MYSEPHLITVFPNPVTNGIIKVLMNEMPSGEYAVRLINNLGQIMHRNKLIHREGNNETINLSSGVAKGIYKLEIISAEKRITTVTVMIQ